MHSKLANPVSRKQIRELTRKIRKIIGYENQLFFPIVEFVELILPQLEPEFEFMVDTKDSMGNCHGLTYPDKNIIKIREDVYCRAIEGSGRDRLTIAHELCHLLIHDNESISLARIEPGSSIVTYCDPEWQANAFGGELLIPKHLIGGLTISEIANKCQVSYSAASIQMRAK